jgi:hypothetical protein
LPFLPLFDVVLGALLARMRNSSGFAGMGKLTFDVMGGKNGKKRQGEVAVLAMDVAVWGQGWRR